MLGGEEILGPVNFGASLRPASGSMIQCRTSRSSLCFDAPGSRAHAGRRSRDTANRGHATVAFEATSITPVPGSTGQERSMTDGGAATARAESRLA